jgi:hypothetical protein
MGTKSIDNRSDGFRTMTFVDTDGKQFHAVLVSKLLDEELVSKMKDLILEGINK